MQTNTSLQSSKLLNHLAWAGILCLLIAVVLWLGKTALYAREQFAAPGWFLAICLVLGVVPALLLLWVVRRHPQPELQSFVHSGGILVVVIGPSLAALWFGLMDNLSSQVQECMKDQAQFLVLAGWLLGCGLAVLIRRKDCGDSEVGVKPIANQAQTSEPGQ